ncbi:VanW family protein [Paenibacillus curdlanolyticus YK9]|uniref:VanW family protein n=1 Tax=Paenibacillus curdlanolyticus YK9 TaxID=717606 RepID=E0ICR7_9BACL|nr:VanW family protein [Paenibacillus curdlanolyticus]EFM09953.1 VanW family protein [Paenibacillus curdlanolyticus YK9]
MVLKWMVAALLFTLPALPNQLPERLIVTHEGQQLAELDRAKYTVPIPGIPVADEARFRKLMIELERSTNRPAMNAGLNGYGGITQEKIGKKLDRNRFTEQFYRFMIEGGDNHIELPQQSIYPKVDSELISVIREKRIGYYTTYYNSRNANRSHNIALAAKAINNTVVFPGESFSFNEVVGMRTVDKGYKSAPVIVRGEVSEGIGGGICQISSTLFNAVDRAGIRIIQRYSHSRNVPYVPPGRDATVSWYGPDFVFHNQYNQPILIRSYANVGTVHIEIYSSELVHFKPKEVPHASQQLPEEVKAERGVHRHSAD